MMVLGRGARADRQALGAPVVSAVDSLERLRAGRVEPLPPDVPRSLADAIPQQVWVTRADGYHEYYNRRWYEFTGMPFGSTDGEGWNGMFHPDDQDRAWEVWRHSLATGEPYEIEYRLRHHSGAYRWTLGRAQPLEEGPRRKPAQPVGEQRAVGDLGIGRDQPDFARAIPAGSRHDQFLLALAKPGRPPRARDWRR